jgi:hypothetical protein
MYASQVVHTLGAYTVGLVTRTPFGLPTKLEVGFASIAMIDLSCQVVKFVEVEKRSSCAL